MANALLTGVTGLIAHQRMLDTVGNNLANLNTTAYKSQRVLFSDLFYTTIRPAATTSSGDLGGSNPSQIGSGTRISQIDRNFGQGTLESTGRLLDFGLQGDGFFVVNDGVSDRYTRAGAFALDESGRLVDPSNGYFVIRTGNIGEPDGTNPAFQTPGDPGITIPFGATIPGAVTSNISMLGNLNAEATEALQEQLFLSTPFLTGGVAATGTTLLNALDSSTTPYTTGDAILISGTDVDGSPVSTTFAVDGATTLNDLTTAISGIFTGATATINTAGNLVLQANSTGPAQLSLTFSNAVGNSGRLNFGQHLERVVIEGKDADQVQHSVEIYDVRGAAHTLELTFTKQDPNTWDMTAALDVSEGTMIDNLVSQIVFNDDGTLQQVLGTGLGDSSITFQLNGISSPQTVQFDFGTSNNVDGLSHLSLDTSFGVQQDGFPAGSLDAINVSADGVIEGIATNGRRFPLAQLAIASFRNSMGLTALGDNYFQQSVNSGVPEIGSALTGKRGSVNSGQLEASNVDISFEFTRMIVAQRGFSANARTITVTDEVLEELTNLIR